MDPHRLTQGSASQAFLQIRNVCKVIDLQLVIDRL